MSRLPRFVLQEFDGSTSSSSTSANLKSSAQPKARLPAEARGLVGQPRPPPADGAASKAKAPRPPSGPPETTPPGKRNLDGKPPPGAPAGAAPLKRAESGPTTSGSRAAGPAKDDFPSARRCGAPLPQRTRLSLPVPHSTLPPHIWCASHAQSSVSPCALIPRSMPAGPKSPENLRRGVFVGLSCSTVSSQPRPWLPLDPQALTDSAPAFDRRGGR